MNDDKNTVSILGVNFYKTTMDGIKHKIIERTKKKERTFIVTANPEIVMQAQQDDHYYDMLQRANYVIADGIGIVKAAALLNNPVPERVAGFDLMIELLKVANENHYSIYMLGGEDKVLQAAAATITSTYPNINIVGKHHGFFDWNSEHIQQEIKDTKPDFVFVALGLPRQEKWIGENISEFEQGTFIGVGGSFDVLAGVVKRAPQVWQTLNIEWLYRLLKQPTRWKRMLVLPKFAMIMLKHKYKKK
jgi:N-acetylglucosaminyldiphosphoundecaprenol N-acetyl-beta-D-mannosaminyltransferase